MEQFLPMDSDRKYRQPGYMDSERDVRPFHEGPKPQGPRPPVDVTGPRLPRLVQHVAAAGASIAPRRFPADIAFTGNCPKCGAELHCCKQCSHFEPSTRFQCLKPIPVADSVRIRQRLHPVCAARDGGARRHRRQPAASASGGCGPAGPTNSEDARSAFDKLFKKL